MPGTLSPREARQKLLLRDLLISIPLIGIHGALAEHSQTTAPSFLFVWPGQDESDGHLDRAGPIITDRPSFTNASNTVGRGVTQIELGYTFTRDLPDNPRSNSHSYPELTLRQGTPFDWLEFRVVQTALTRELSSEHTTGLSDIKISTKLGLAPHHGYFPEITVIPELRLPTGSDELHTDYVLPGVSIPYSWNLGEVTWLSGDTQFLGREAEGSQHLYTVLAQSALAGVSLSQTLSVWLEWYAYFPLSSHTEKDTHYIDSGFAYLITTSIQLDARIGTRLNNNVGDEFFTGVGCSTKFQ